MHKASPAQRNRGLDALRGSLTLLVLLHHTALTYGAPGAWFYREIAPDGSPSSLLLTLFVAVNQAFFMGLFFLLAGYFTPASLRAKGVARFSRDRLRRLGLPLLAFGLVLGPVTVALAQTGRGRPFLDTLLALWRQLRFVEGPLWFAEALLIFSAAALLWHLTVRHKGGVAQTEDRTFPSNRALAAAAIGTGLAAFGLRLWWPVGTEIWGLQLGYFAGYTVLFVTGCLAADQNWLERIPPVRVRLWSRVALICIPVLPLGILLGAQWPALGGPTEGGVNAQALLYALWEPLVAWGIILWLLAFYQRRFPRLDGLWRPLAARAYTIYIIHPPVLVVVALAGRDIAAPALLKFGVTGLATCAISFSLAGLILRIPAARRIL
ncbi:MULTISPECIES: acyltransferase family protein [Rhodopseudomonas]|nr:MULTISPECIES: acyltransferase family protein [Rhodopseudomonas]MDF3808695.1 acyltransferase family protein [Rhodopseudomonas sp. BAL398]WOK15637.1 acyltransferase family protein [Rhodopseudomonas sp. BAL398]